MSYLMSRGFLEYIYKALISHQSIATQRSKLLHHPNHHLNDMTPHSGPGPKTTWEDLSNLGWYKQQVYEKADAARGGTMEGIGDISLNDGIAADYQYVTII